MLPDTGAEGVGHTAEGVGRRPEGVGHRPEEAEHSLAGVGHLVDSQEVLRHILEGAGHEDRKWVFYPAAVAGFRPCSCNGT